MLQPSGLIAVFPRRLLHPVWEVVLKPVSSFAADTQITAGLAVYPASQVDPAGDFFRVLAVPGHIFGQMTVGFGAVIPKILQHINAHFFFF